LEDRGHIGLFPEAFFKHIGAVPILFQGVLMRYRANARDFWRNWTKRPCQPRSLPVSGRISSTPAKKGQASLQVVGNDGQVHHLIGLFEP